MSTLSVGTIQNSSSGAPVFKESGGTEIGQLIKAWIQFQGSGTVAIRDSFNVSSITDHGTGDYTITYSNDFSNDDYCLEGTPTEDENQSAGSRGQMCLSPTRTPHAAGSSRVHTFVSNDASLFDCGRIEVMVTGDN